jgi:hypothetical protein
MRILLAGAVVFLAVWFTLLRPKSDAAPPVPAAATPATTAVSGPGKVVEKAKSAAATAESAAKAAAGESTDSTQVTPGAATTSAPDPKAETPAVSIPAAQLAKLPKDVAGAVTGHKVLVLAVLSDDATRWRPMADDDRYVRNTLKKVNRYDGEVVVKQVGLGSVRMYGGLVNGLKVNQTPSVVVVDRKLKANVLEGYVDRISINQAIADARRASTDRLITDAYLREANQVCANGSIGIDRWSLPTVPGKKALAASTLRFEKVLGDYALAVKKLPAPARWRGLKRQWLRELAGERRLAAKTLGKVRGDDLAGAIAGLAAWDQTAARKLDQRFDAAGLTSCSVLRRS